MNNSILEQLKDNDIQVAQIARDLRVTPRAVYHSIAGSGSRNIRVAIARQLDKSPSSLWLANSPATKHVDDALYYHNVDGANS